MNWGRVLTAGEGQALYITLQYHRVHVVSTVSVGMCTSCDSSSMCQWLVKADIVCTVYKRWCVSTVVSTDLEYLVQCTHTQQTTYENMP